jgi:peptide/nickel transport system substrate-binding protein
MLYNQRINVNINLKRGFMFFRSVKFVKFVSLLTLLGLLLSGCGILGNGINQPADTVTPEPAATTAPVEPKKLVICLGEEPQSLFLYAPSTRAMWSVLEAVYDGPIDTRGFEMSPVILEDLPTLENGGVTLLPTPVTAGDVVANTEGDLVALQQGVRVFPAGCTSNTCAVEWDGNTELSLVQMSATFKLLPGLKWSDGKPLLAGDSVFSYEVSANPALNVGQDYVKRTASYEALNDQTVKWMGIPGYLTTQPSNYFWIPQPRHLLETIAVGQMTTAEASSRQPLGWGPYQVDEWVSGDHIRMIKNPNYFRAAEGLPVFDELIYKFMPALPEADLSPMTNGQCDIMETSSGLEGQIQTVRELELAGSLKSYFGQGLSWELINFGIVPASHDEVYNPWQDRADIFGDLRVRQAFAYCTDREKIIQDVLFSQSQVPTTYLPVAHPLAVSGLMTLPHDPVKGIQLLEEVGWQDADNDINTPRTALDVATVNYDTKLSVTYSLTDTPQHRLIVPIVVDSLRECGFEVIPQYLPAAELLAAGPEGVLFGRNFDLAELSWASGQNAPCFLYATSEIPASKNAWLGTKYAGINITGYSNEEYDLACASLLSAGLDDESIRANNRITQQRFADDLPVLPLFYQVKVMVSRVDLCGLDLDTSSRSPLSQIEALTIDQAFSSQT